MVERLVRENGELREEMDNLRNMVTRLTEQRAETARALGSLVAYVAAVKDEVMRRSSEGTRLVPLRPRVVAQDALDRSERGE